MDRLTQLRGEAGGSGDSTLDTSASPSEAFMTANESSKYFSLTEEDSSFDISPIKDVSLASTVEPEKAIAGDDQLISDLTPITKKRDLLDGYKFGKQIEAANILSGGVDIFDDNDNSYDGDELVIDDNADIDDKINPELKLIENTDLPFQKPEEIAESLDSNPTIGSKDTEVVLQIDGKNVNAIDIGNGLYLYRKAGEEELAAVQIVADDHDQPTFKFLKVRENAEGNLEVYEEIEIEVPKEVPTKDEKSEKNTSHVPIKDISKVISEPVCNKVAERKKPQQEIKPIASTSDNDEQNKMVLTENKPEINLNGKMMKYNETRKSPVIHSTPNKEGIPLTKTMVDMHLHPSRPLDKVKTIEVHTDNIKQRIADIQTKNKDLADDHKCDTNGKEIEKPKKIIETDAGSKELNEKTCDAAISIEKQNLEKTDVQPIECPESKQIPSDINLKKCNTLIKEEDKSVFIGQKEQKLQTNVKKDDKISEKPESQILKENFDSKVIQDKKISEIVQDSAISEYVEPNVKNDNLDINVKKKQEELKSEQDEKELHEVKLGMLNKMKSDDKKKDNPIEQDIKNPAGKVSLTVSETSKEKELKDSAQPKFQEVSVTPKENKVTKNVAPEVSNKIRSEECTEKRNYNTTEHKTVQLITKNIADNKMNTDSEIHEGNVLSEAPKEDESKIINIELRSHQADKITLNTPVTEIKQSKLYTPSQVEVFSNKDISKPETKLLDQGKLICTDVVKGTSVVQPKQSGVNESEGLKKPLAANKAVPETPQKSAPIGQEFIQSTSSVKKQNETKTEFKANLPTKLPVTVPVGPQRKPEISKIPSNTMEKKPIFNNNAAVPFGQWTSANRQEFLNKIKEAKIPINVSNTKSISKPNDLNRRDVLQKIDSQRQSSNAASKNQEFAKLNIKNEVPTFTNKPATSHSKTSTVMQESNAPLKVEAQALKNKPVLLKKVEKPITSESSHKPQSNLTVTNTYVAKSEGQNRNEFNNQHLIDKTVEGIINRAVSTKQQDTKPNRPKEPVKTQTSFATNFKSRDSKPSILDAIEMKMNELHGIPFVERPPHELPKVYNLDIKTYAKADNSNSNLSSKASQSQNLLPVAKSQQKHIKNDVIDLDSEEEIIEHEPITGDIDLHKKNITSKQSNTSAETNMAQIGSDSSKKESIITEKDFDKFVRRNSIAYENCLTVNIEKNKNRNVVQGLIQKDIPDQNTKKEISETKTSSPKQNNHPNKIHVTSKLVPVDEDAFNKNYQSKLQLAYQSALTTKRQMESPITILEDKPVKVVFMDSNINFQASQLNVQGQDLSPTKKSLVPREPDSITISTCDSLDSEVLNSVEDIKPQEETKSNKTKHQRKQVLTPVETPELELIVPGDLGIEVSPKKKRRTDDLKVDKITKSLLPKKSYLLGRNVEHPIPQDSSKDPKQGEERTDIMISRNDTASAIDNLVKAAELIENQSVNFKSDTNIPTSDATSPITPIKRGRGRPRKYPLPDATSDSPKAPSPQKKPRLIHTKDKTRASQSTTDEDNSDDSGGEGIVRENWTMGKINENIVCPICKKLFRSENVVFKHVKHCTGPSPNRSDSDKRSLRRSRLSYDSKSMDSKLDDTDGETDSVISKKSELKRKSKELSSDGNEEIIVIEDTPVKSKVEKSVEPKQHESRNPTKTKAQYKVHSTLSCEHCGKTFRQLSYLVNHKQLHKKANPQNEVQVIDKSVYSCEVCKKEFRKLHHLVQHRIIHNPSNVAKPSRKSSSEQNVENKTSKDKEKEVKQAEDQSAAFRCEPCDKSFRKLHHLVEHRETHDGINRQKGTPTIQTEKIIQNPPPPPPQCDVCKKTFRKLHHLIEHKEQHLETSSEKSDNKSVKSALSTKDIIHECSLCYMVFPNEHSLNKHSVFCQKKKRSTKQSKQLDESVTAESKEIPNEKENTTLDTIIPKLDEIIDAAAASSKNTVENSVKESVDINKIDTKTENREKQSPKEDENLLELPIASNNRDPEESMSSSIKVIKDAPAEVPQKIGKSEEKAEVDLKNTTDISKKKTPTKGVSAAKRRKSNLPLAQIKETVSMESSDDDDDVRYMLNPDYIDSPPKAEVDDSSEVKLFMKVKAKKRNSLQFERPNSKDLIKRRISLQHPPKIPRLKRMTEVNDASTYPPQPDISKTAKLENTDSDDSDVKYSFPVEVLKAMESVKSPKEKRKSQNEKAHKTVESKITPKEKRKSLAEKRKLLSGIARRKSLGKPTLVKHKENASPVKEIKRRRAEVEHRCDCGQLFSSAALLSRHTTLAHTPPRVRRRRTATPPPACHAPSAPPTRKLSNHKSTESRKSSVRSDTDNTAPPKAKPGRPPGKTNARTPVRKSVKAQQTIAQSGLQSSRKLAAHRGVPVPDKMKKAMEKLKL